jgi:ClpX C4-type zinc finger
MSKVAGGDSKNMLFCSFCGKNQHEVRKLIAGPTVFICDECVELCKDIIHEETKSSLEKSRDGIPTPKELRKVVDDYVVGRTTPRRCSRWRFTITTNASGLGPQLALRKLCPFIVRPPRASVDSKRLHFDTARIAIHLPHRIFERASPDSVVTNTISLRDDSLSPR